MMIGETIGAHRVLETRGEGGLSQVYRARDTRLHRDVATKVLPEAVANNAERLARFTREARAVAVLNHPHAVTIYSTEEDDGGLCAIEAASRAIFLDPHSADARTALAGALLTSKGTIRFQPDHPLPATLVRKIVRARIAENAAAAVRRARRRTAGSGL